MRLLAALLLLPALASAQGAIGVAAPGGGGAIPECSGDQSAFGVCLDTSTGNLIWEGATADAFEGTLAFPDPGSDFTVTMPSATTTLAGLAIAQTWTAPQTIAAGAGQTLNIGSSSYGLGWSGATQVGFYISQSMFVVANNGDASLQADSALGWTSSTSAATGSIDTGLERNSAAVVRVTNGSTGRGSLIVGGAAQLQLVDDGTKPTCDASTRGSIWYDAGGAGVADTFELCRKDSGDSYAWVTLF